MMADGMGFEHMVANSYIRVPGVHLKPLGQPSKSEIEL